MNHDPERTNYDILIVGGGAAGLAAAVSAGLFAKSASPAKALRMGIVEKKEVPGKKLSATGNGRCNLSNAACVDREEVDGFFDALGLVTRTDEAGRMYPYGEEAGEVTALLTETARSLQVEILTGCAAEEVASSAGEGDGFQVKVSRSGSMETLRCRRLLLAMGGKSCSVFGTTGDGCVLARRLGHTVTPLAPSLVPVQVTEDLRPLAGVRTRAAAYLLHLGQPVACETGEVQFNKDALSGICIMNLSRLLVLNRKKPFEEAFREYQLVLDLLPEYSEEDLAELLVRKQGSLQTLVKRKLGLWLDGRTDTAADAGPGSMAFLLKHLTFTVCGTKGWNDAQVTRGGVVLDEVDRETMESRKVQGLYFAGEILDYDGPCGGFNLHFAWKTGIRAGRAMVSSAQKEKEKDVSNSSDQAGSQ